MRALKLIMIVFILSMTVKALSQPYPDEFFDGPVKGPGHERIRERIKTIKIWKLTEELNLTEEQAENFFPAYQKHQGEREGINAERKELLKQLDGQTKKENADDKEIIRLLDQLENLNRQMNEKRIEFRRKLEGILTTRQLGQLVIFELRFQHQIREIIRDTQKDMRDSMKRNRRNR
ncbi:MAG: hypothetical protein J7K40_01740 [candidate division Zixibacteria bacterium]|nr:hypothetical protein [candidate division Zixibacteria bacterium]